MSDWVIQTRGLGKSYRLYQSPAHRLRELLSPTRAIYHREVWALRDVDLEVGRGTVTGLVGVNGAGKSTLLKIIAGSLPATCGEVEVKGRVSSILELGTGFQPHMTGRQNAFVNALFLGMRPWEVESKLEEVIAFSGIGEYADQPLSTYSSGMQARLAFSVLTLLDPEVLILDEALATGDAGFAEKCKHFMRTLCRSGCTTLLAGHDVGFMADACDRVVWIDHGKVRATGDPTKILTAYRDALGVHTGDLAPRPRHAILRFESEHPDKQDALIVHGAEWIGPAGQSLGSYPVGLENWFAICLSAAVEAGITPASARAGWGPAQDIPGRGKYRACRPDLGPGGAAYLGLPVPLAPHPVPARLRLYLYMDDPSARVVVSAQANGRYREVLRVTPDPQKTWTIVDADVSAVFQPEGQPAPAFATERVAGPPAGAVLVL